MRKITSIFKFLLFFSLVTLFFVINMKITDKDKEEYFAIVKKNDDKKELCQNSLPLLFCAEHKRENVCKEFWGKDDNDNYCRIEAKKSSLSFDRKNIFGGIEEQMVDVSCLLKGKSCNDNDTLRTVDYVEAKRARYDYNRNRCLAQDVIIKRYCIDDSCDEKKEKLLMEGSASELEFAILKNGLMEMKAKNLQAMFDDKGSPIYLRAQKANYKDSLVELTGDVSVHDARVEIEARTAVVKQKTEKLSDQIEKIDLMQDVYLMNIDKEQYALADKVTFYPDNKTVILVGEENRVLFFDKKQMMQISAPQVEVCHSTVKGVGDVKFILGTDELNKLKDRFQW